MPCTNQNELANVHLLKPQYYSSITNEGTEERIKASKSNLHKKPQTESGNGTSGSAIHQSEKTEKRERSTFAYHHTN